MQVPQHSPKSVSGNIQRWNGGLLTAAICRTNATNKGRATERDSSITKKVWRIPRQTFLY